MYFQRLLMILVGNMLGTLPWKLPRRIAWMSSTKNAAKLFEYLPWKHVPYRIVWIFPWKRAVPNCLDFSTRTCREYCSDFFQNCGAELLECLQWKHTMPNHLDYLHDIVWKYAVELFGKDCRAELFRFLPWKHAVLNSWGKIVVPNCLGFFHRNMLCWITWKILPCRILWSVPRIYAVLNRTSLFKLLLWK